MSAGVESARLRFNKREFARALRALEKVDGSEFDLALEAERLREEREDARDEARKWHDSYDVLADILRQLTPDQRLAKLDEALRTMAVS